ncbi:MAG: hypothetical protein ACE5GD_03330 [Candidatus Geothermarchaeales archaeon]
MSAWGRCRPYTYPDSSIRLVASIRLLFQLPYRPLETLVEDSLKNLGR